MSWFSSLFSASKPSSIPSTTSNALHEQRILEEPEPKAPAITTNHVPQNQILQSSPTTERDRSNRNKVIFGAGIGFFAFSMLITRRSFARRRLASQAAFYADAPGHHVEQSKNVSGAMEAMEALNIATINVLSVAMMATGGALWYLDINSMEDARRKLRGGLGVDGSGKSEKEAEEEFEEWMATTLSRKDAKEKKKKSEDR